MRLHILRALLKKEFQRHLANRGGIALALLLVAAAILLSLFSPKEATGGSAGMVGSVQHCYIDYDDSSPLLRSLARLLDANTPHDSGNQIIVRPLAEATVIDGVVTYQTGTGALQLRPAKGPDARPTVHIYVWHPKGDPAALAPYETWFWKESRRFFLAQSKAALEKLS